MWLYIRQLLQLLIGPTRGWEDISSAVRTHDEIFKRGFAPWILIAGCAHFLKLLYDIDITFVRALQDAIVTSGGLFISNIVCRLFLEIGISKNIDNKANTEKIAIITDYMIGLVGLYNIVRCAVPAEITPLYFMPLLSVFVIYNSTKFLGVKEDMVLSYTFLASVGTILVPIGACALLSLII